MQQKTIKYAVFIFVVFAVIALLLAVLANVNTIIANAVWILLVIAFLLVVWKFDFIIMLQDYERAVIMRFGRVNRVGGPGWCLVMPGIETATLVDLRTQTIDVPKQDVVTKENIELKIDAVLYLRINKDKQSVINSVVEVQDYKSAVQLYVVSSLRDIIGGMLLPDVISNIEEIETKLQVAVEAISKDWGIKIVSIDLKDVDIPRTVLDAMHAEKAAVQQKLARMEKAKAHQAEIEAVREAAENLSDRALAYYYIKALEKLGKGKSTKFIFPMELSRLAEAIGSKVSGASGAQSEKQLERLFEKYAPRVLGVLNKNEKQAPSRGKKKR